MSAPEAKPCRSLGRGWLALFAGAAAAVPLLYAAYTGHVWEDFFITFRHSQNLCEGHGLVYRPGERVHGFTSPLGTLLPALCYLATGMRSYLPALWLFRVLSAAAFAGGGLLAGRAVSGDRRGKPAALAFAILYLLEAKSVVFSANGMETAFMLLFLGWGLWLSGQDLSAKWLACGLCWAGLIWTRPDSCVVVAALAAASLAFPALPRRALLRALLRSAAVAAVVYLPWVVGAWAYYGSPVPNTIRAKSALGGAEQTALEVVQGAVGRIPERLAEVFGPVYADLGGWPSWVGVVTVALGLFCALYWVLPGGDRIGRRASLAFALLSLYLAALPKCYPWYLPPAALCGLVVLARSGAAAVERLGGSRRVLAGAAVALLFLAGERAWLFARTAEEMKAQQAEIEWGNRARVGLWLKDEVKDGERVYVECLGYIGYFSGAKMLDYPGLVSPEVVREARHRPNDLASVGIRLAPEWMVLRPGEAKALERFGDFRKHYVRVRRFDVTDRLGRYGDFPGKRYLRFDAAFDIFKRVPQPSPPTAGAG